MAITPKQYPILFSTEMVQAILAGRKKQTRRIVKFPKQLKIHEQLQWEIKAAPDSPGYYRFEHETKYGVPYIKCKYSIGDTLWAREAFAVIASRYVYKADLLDVPKWKDIPWKSPIFMPYQACRIKLKITNIRVERLNDISIKDAIAEGIECSGKNPYGYKNYLSKDGYPHGGDLYSYKSLWQSINGPDSWDLNPWVWVYDFEVIK